LVEFSVSVECNTGTTYTPTLNGISKPPFNQTPNNCGCGFQNNVVSMNIPVAGYVVGGVNQFRVPTTNCWGLTQAASLSNSYARITVTYSTTPVVQTAGLPSGSTFPVGTTVNTFTATDAGGNTSTCSFNVTVLDIQAPTITCPSNITVNNTPGTCGSNVTYSIVFSDNCSTPPAEVVSNGGF
jgi:hypothetical protein